MNSIWHLFTAVRSAARWIAGVLLFPIEAVVFIVDKRRKGSLLLVVRRGKVLLHRRHRGLLSGALFGRIDLLTARRHLPAAIRPVALGGDPVVVERDVAVVDQCDRGFSPIAGGDHSLVVAFGQSAGDVEP